MGGTIGVQSEPGKGSTFSFTARFGCRRDAPKLAACPPGLLRGLRDLVVDDNATNRHILQEWLRAWQMEPAEAGDGLGALDALWHGVASGRPYDLVLLDGRMPDTDGLTLAARIRERAELARARLILLTSGDRPGDLSRSRDLGLAAHLLKPVQQQELLGTIDRAMSRTEDDRLGRPVEQPTEKEPGPPQAAGLRVLVAEDNEFNAQLMEQLLARRGHEVRLASNGRAALAAAERGDVDLMLLDVHMPELDGFAVIKAIRERERTTGTHLPVIALTARSRREDRERCLAAGMDDYLAKPVSAADLWAAIDRAAPRPAGRPKAALLDARVLLATCGGDGAILARISEAFRTRLPGQAAAVRGALHAGDAGRLREAAHKLAGIVSAFSSAAGAVASGLEDRAAAGRLGECGPLVERLMGMAEDLVEQARGVSIESLREQVVG